MTHATNDLFGLRSSGAHFGENRKYRYSLRRNWREPSRTSKGIAMFIGLNPSTADETSDDPTIRRCMTFARDWGYDGLFMANLFAFRATEPKVMLAEQEPIGPENDMHLLALAKEAGIVVAAWGISPTADRLDAQWHLGRL